MKKQENNVEKTRKKDENVDLSTASETAETARFSPPDEPPQDALDAGFRVENASVSAPDFAKENNFTGNDFYLAVKPQLDEMFICFPKNTDLENAVPNSKWVNVSGDDGNYVVGLIFNLDEVEYICYGVPYEKKSPPPDEIKNVCDWLALTDDENGKGYYVIYQSAKSGKTLSREDFNE